MRRLRGTTMLLGAVLLRAMAAAPALAAPAAPSSEFVLAQGQREAFPDLGLTVKATAIRDYTSRGCLGGPTGCPDAVELDVSRGAETRHVTLRVAHTRGQASRGVNRSEAFGHAVSLVALHDGRATLTIARRP